MEISFKEMMESDGYSKQRIIVNNEVNYGGREYFPDRRVFKHLPSEISELEDKKKKWRKKMRERWGPSWTKRSASRKHGEFHNRMN